MAHFKTNFWALLAEKEVRDGTRGKNKSINSMAAEMGISRVTFYRYANSDQLKNVDAETVATLMSFLGLPDEEIGRFLVITPGSKQNGRSHKTKR